MTIDLINNFIDSVVNCLIVEYKYNKQVAEKMVLDSVFAKVIKEDWAEDILEEQQKLKNVGAALK